MTPVERQKKLARNSRVIQLLGMGIAMAIVGLLAASLLSGSNHTCPVLRQQDLEKGPSARAVPAFARKYKVDCIYCHTAWPQLNRTGYIFRRLGYRMPYEVPIASGASSANAPPEAGSPTTPAPAIPPTVISGLKQAVTIADKQAAPPETIAAGQKVFQQMQCFTCHTNGENLIDPSKPIKGTDFLKKYPEDRQIADIIRHGRPGTAMPAYSQQRLSDEQLSTLIAYIRNLTPPPQ
jgi:mono/diheme cytochrome c family protein